MSRPHLNVCLLGHEGHGKSTLYKALAPGGGSIALRNRDVQLFDPPSAWALESIAAHLTQCDAILIVVSVEASVTPLLGAQLELARVCDVQRALIVLSHCEQEQEEEVLDLVEFEVRDALHQRGFDGDEAPAFRGVDSIASILMSLDLTLSLPANPEASPRSEVTRLSARLDRLRSVDPADDPAPLKSSDELCVVVRDAHQRARLRPTSASLYPGDDGAIELEFEKPIHARTNDRLFLFRLGGKDLFACGLVQRTHPSFLSKDLRGQDFSGASLSQADFRSAKLGEANFSRAQLSNANLMSAQLPAAQLPHANLSRADLSHADLAGADLSNANLRGADLMGANLAQANLTGADLSEANLRGVNLEGAACDDATFTQADLLGVRLHGAEFRMEALQAGRNFTPIPREGRRPAWQGCSCCGPSWGCPYGHGDIFWDQDACMVCGWH